MLVDNPAERALVCWWSEGMVPAVKLVACPELEEGVDVGGVGISCEHSVVDKSNQGYVGADAVANRLLVVELLGPVR